MSDIEVIAYWSDADGNPVDNPADAHHGELVELIGGYEVRRTYADLVDDGRNQLFDVPAETSDLDPENQDAMKKTWDLFVVRDGVWEKPVTTLAEFLVAVELDRLSLEAQRQRVGAYLTLPIWEGAPAELKAEVYTWLESTRQE